MGDVFDASAKKKIRAQLNSFNCSFGLVRASLSPGGRF